MLKKVSLVSEGRFVKRAIRFPVLTLVFMMLCACTSNRVPVITSVESAPAPSPSQEELASSFASRPGLGTSWGEAVRSPIEYATFDRENHSSPDSVVRVYYNDRAGLSAMLNNYGEARSQAFEILSGSIRFGITDEDNRHSGTPLFLPALKSGRAYYVQGEYGSRYGVWLENRSGSRIEVVTSVDGLDVIDGRTAAFGKGGYLVDPGATLLIDGFRTSMEDVAAFRFGSVADSYAQKKYGDARNVGVIGIAIFREKGSPLLLLQSQEIKTRKRANPFPGQFSTPP